MLHGPILDRPNGLSYAPLSPKVLKNSQVDVPDQEYAVPNGIHDRNKLLPDDRAERRKVPPHRVLRMLLWIRVG